MKEKILDANRRTHSIEASVYDSHHGEIFNAYTQAFTLRSIQGGVEQLRRTSKNSSRFELHALDCACGTGNISEKLLRLGCTVDGLDISPEMLTVMDIKLKGRYQGRYRLINNDIDSFLLDPCNEERYHVVSFSSALHHLPDYEATVLRAIEVIRRPGVLLVFHEPLPAQHTYVHPISHVLRRIDRLVWKYSGKITRRPPLKQTISADDAQLTDYHSHRGGVDPELLMNLARRSDGIVTTFLNRSENMRHFWSAGVDNIFGLRRDSYFLQVLFA